MRTVSRPSFSNSARHLASSLSLGCMAKSPKPTDAPTAPTKKRPRKLLDEGDLKRADFHKRSTHSAWTSWQPWRVHCLNAVLEQPWPAALVHCLNAVLEFRPEPETANISPCRMA